MTSIFSKNLRKFMDKKNLTGKIISEIMDVSTGTVIHWSNGRRFPNEENIQKLSNILNINPSELFEENDKNKLKTIPLIGLASCGIPQEYDLNGYEQVAISEAIYEEGMYAVRAEGDSMSPKINNNSIIYCNVNRQIENGNIVHYLLNGESGIKRYKINEKMDTVSLVPINSDFDVIAVDEKDYPNLKMARVIGVVDTNF
ncbi:MAG: XRE family transcriptional regulator [Sulfurimonas sp.]